MAGSIWCRNDVTFTASVWNFVVVFSPMALFFFACSLLLVETAFASSSLLPLRYQHLHLLLSLN